MRTRFGYFLLGQIGLLVMWEMIARSGVAGLTVPTLTSVAAIYVEPRFAALLYRSALATAASALGGFLLGILLGLVTAVFSHVVPSLRPGLDRLAVTVNAIPAIALGPVFILLVSRENTPLLLATISVFFIIYVAVTSGLRNAPRPFVNMMRTLGADKWQLLRYMELPSALRAFLGGAKLALPAAMIGSVVGEWFGAPTGLGIVILNTMQNFQIPLLWAAVLLVAGISLSGYGLANGAEHLLERRFR